MTDAEYLKSRNVDALIHFTPVSNLESIIEHGLISPQEIAKLSLAATINDQYRHDGTDHVNLSITNPNINLLFSFRKTHPDRTYAVIKLDPDVLNTVECRFCSTNAASSKSDFVNVKELFEGYRPSHFPANWTTDNQSEILVYERIDPRFITEIDIFNDGPDAIDSFDRIRKQVAIKDLPARVRKIDYEYNRAPLECVNYQEMADDQFDMAYAASWSEPMPAQEIVQLARSLRPKTVFFDSVAYPKEELAEMLAVNTDTLVEGRKEWSLSFLALPSEDLSPLSPAELSALAATEKIVNRGRRTTLSPTLERELKGRCSSRRVLVDATSAVHMLQATLVELVKAQKLMPGYRLSVDSRMWNTSAQRLMSLALGDLKELVSAVCKLYGVRDFLSEVEVVENSVDADLVLHFDKPTLSATSKTDVLIKRENASELYDFTFTRVQHRVNIDLSKEEAKPMLETLLLHSFGFGSFLPNQMEGIVRGLKGQDTIVLLPTGSGKSIVYQLLALITPGIAYIVDPIVSLIEDQIENLYARGIDRVVGLSSHMSKSEKDRSIEGIASGRYFMAFVAPERFQMRDFLDAVAKHAYTNITSVIAIDEAHCVSEWGHDFRTSYLGLARSSREICTTSESTPPLLALTGTASPSVLKDMQRDLEIDGAGSIIVPSSFDRKELVYRIVRADLDQKPAVLREILEHAIPAEFGETASTFYRLDGVNTNSGLIFCPNASGTYGFATSNGQKKHGSYGVWETAQNTIPSIGIYSGKRPNNIPSLEKDWEKQKRVFAKEFKENRIPALAATKAFGMGIDKPNIRWIVHFGIPSSLESYYQEAGRAGRDRQKSVCFVLLTNSNEQGNNRLLDPARTPVENIVAKDEEMKGAFSGDDVSKNLFFHGNTFSGLEKELATCEEVLKRCRENWNKKDERFHLPRPENDDAAKAYEKAVYRLKLLGIFESYVVDYKHDGKDGEFVIKSVPKLDKEKTIRCYLDYVSAYQQDEQYLSIAEQRFRQRTDGLDGIDFIVAAVRTLLQDFTYSVVEEGRRRALKKMLDVATEASKFATAKQSDKYFRQQLLDYLKVDKKLELEDLLENATDSSMAFQVAFSPRGAREISSLLGQIDRYLEAYPHHFGLHLAKTLLHLRLGDGDSAADSLTDLFYFGEDRYGLQRKTILEVFLSLLAMANPSEMSDTTEEGWYNILSSVEESIGMPCDRDFDRLNIANLKTALGIRSAYRAAAIIKEMN